MINNNLTKAKKIHFVGIGGIGMSALAKLLSKYGIEVSGSDMSENEQTKELQKQKIEISIGHHLGNITNQDLVIHSLAIPRSNIELKKAREKKIQIISYPQALGTLTKNFDLIAVAGTHGKTTTTGMTAKLLQDSGFDPTVIVGSTSKDLENQNYRKGESNWFLLEACEYHAGFLHLEPEITIITNLEHDHFDAYPEEKDYLDAFQKLVNKTKSAVIINMDYPLAAKLKLPESITVIKYKEGDKELKLGIPGKHNKTNATAVLLLADYLEIDHIDALKSISTFSGTGRRLELVKKTKTQVFYDDYGHHPSEIKATLQAIKEKYPKSKVCLIFQAHQHNRTIALLDQFKKSFELADKVVIPDIYKARDTGEEISKMPAKKFAEEISKNHKKVEYSESLENTKNKIASITKGYDVVIIMGAGNVYQIIR